MVEAGRLLSTLALNAAWQLVAVVAAAAAADLLLRRSPARTRHALWVATVTLAALLPFVALVPREPSPSRARAALPAAPEIAAPAPAAAPATAPSHISLSVPGGAGLALVVLLLAAAAFRGARLIAALRRAARLRGTAREEASEKVRALARDCAGALGLPPVPVLSAPGLDGPVTVGALRPVVLLPSGFAAAHEDDAIRAALGHELAHVRRRDYALNLAFETLLLPFAWHPAALVLRRKLGETREMACDELAAGLLLGPRRYARSLVAVASGIGRASPSPALGVDDAGILEDRIRHLLRPRGASPARRRLGIAAGVALLLLTTLSASVAVVEAKPLPAAPAEWRSEMKNVVAAMVLALGLPASGDELTKGLEALKAGDLVAAENSVEKAVAANPKDRDAHYTLGVIRWQDAYNGVGEARKAGKITSADRDRLKKTVALGHDSFRKATALDPGFFEAYLYDSLLCRLDGELASDEAEAKKYAAKADEILAKAKQLKETGVSAASPRVALPMPPPPAPPAKKAQTPPPPPPPPPAR